MNDDVRRTFALIAKHPFIPTSEKQSRRVVFMAYVGSLLITVANVRLYVYAHNLTASWAVALLSTSLLFAVLAVSFLLGWGPALACALVEVCLRAYITFPAVPAQQATTIVFVYAVLLTALSFFPASLRISLTHDSEQAGTHIKELQELNATLRRESTRKDEFFNIASHELRTPLTSISLACQLLKRQLFPPDDTHRVSPLVGVVAPLVQENLDVMESQIRRINGLVNEMMDAARLNRGQLVVNLEETNLVAVTADTVRQLRHLFSDRTLIFRPPRTPIYVDADPLRLTQVLYNFVSNACKFSEVSEPIDIFILSDAREAVVTVRDCGPGIPPDQQDAVWERYYTAQPGQQQLSHSSYMGLGLGLYISRRIVEQHGGQVGVRSSPGVGSAFWFSLPISKQPDEPVTTAAAPAHSVERLFIIGGRDGDGSATDRAG